MFFAINKIFFCNYSICILGRMNRIRTINLVDIVAEAELAVAVVAPAEDFAGFENCHRTRLAARYRDHLKFGFIIKFTLCGKKIFVWFSETTTIFISNVYHAGYLPKNTSDLRPKLFKG
jgi:hypothetical protein